MLFILYWHECRPLDVSVHCVSLALIQVNWVGHVKQLLRRVNEKTKFPRYLYSCCSVFKIPIRIDCILFRKELLHCFCLRKITGDILLWYLQYSFGKAARTMHHDHLLGYKVITHWKCTLCIKHFIGLIAVGSENFSIVYPESNYLPL